jgi:KDO2-lipid IV(A) lauroyltransferase
LSDFLFFIIFYLIKYRKKIVEQNLKTAFPQKNQKEIQQITRKFYVYLIDTMLETLKMSTISEKQLKKRIYFEDLSVVNALEKQNKNFILALGHCGNWEWGSAIFQIQTNYQILVIYKPLSNLFFDDLIKKWRTRFGQKASPMKNTLRNMLVEQKNGLFATALIADQRPENPNDAFWTTFLNKEAGFLWGTEKLAQKFDMPVVFAHVKQEKRGKYKIELTLLTDNPKPTQEGEITQNFVTNLEIAIKNQPYCWLWSHDRWKHSKPFQS